MNPETAAKAMEKDGSGIDTEPTDDLAGLEGESIDETPTLEDDNSGFLDNITGRLMATEPNPDLQSVESPYNPQKGGTSRIFRGVQKMGDIEGLPAIADIIIGILEVAQDDSISLGQQSSQQNDDPQNEIENI